MNDDTIETQSGAARPELLAPAGNWDCVRAAAANGADAVYFGLASFNARMRAENFTLDDLPAIVEFLHARNMRAHLTLNTLVFTRELEEAERVLAALQESRVDVVIVQDLGIASLSREVAPSVDVHGSTQMTITSPEGARFAERRLGLSQAVLARELSLREIAAFGGQALPVEVFVHGALCVAYSGQCLTSESLGQRSANRGECAQACRQPYELVVDGRLVDLGDRRFLLSPQDLAALDAIPELVRLGVRTLKIEGRLKSPEYVAAVTDVYRRALDAVFEPETRSKSGADPRYRLESVFSRGLYTGWLRGDDHQELVHARFGKKRGPFVGHVARVGRDHVELDADPPDFLRAGDGLVFDTGGDTEHEEGGRVWEIRGRALRFANQRIDFGRLSRGNRVWKTDDPKLRRELRRSFAGEIPVRRRRSIDLRVGGRLGEALVIECDFEGRTIRVESGCTLEAARSRGLDEPLLRAKLGRLGDTPFELRRVAMAIPERAAIAVSELNRLRRTLCELLLSTRDGDGDERGATRGVVVRELERIRRAQPMDVGGRAGRLSVLCRSLAQLAATIELGVGRVLVDFEDIRRYADAARMFRDAGDAELYLATPRIQKPGESGFFNAIERHADARGAGVLVRNLGALEFFRSRQVRLAGDYSLNVANPLTADLLLSEGLEWLTASYDLDAQQLVDLLEGAPDGSLEVTLHQHMPMFHMAHCVFAAFLSEGKDHTDCGHPCDRHHLELRDHVGMAHPVHADVGCRNTVFNARAQSGAKFHRAFARAGGRSFRVELLDEDGARTRKTISAYGRLLTGELGATELVRELEVESKLGVTLGTMRVMS